MLHLLFLDAISELSVFPHCPSFMVSLSRVCGAYSVLSVAFSPNFSFCVPTEAVDIHTGQTVAIAKPCGSALPAGPHEFVNLTPTECSHLASRELSYPPQDALFYLVHMVS